MSAQPGQVYAVAPRTEWPAILRETTAEVFSTMVGGDVAFPENDSVPAISGITGVVGIAGSLSAILSLRCSLQSAILMASHMLAVPAAEADAQKADALGEISNIVAGYFKAKIGLGDKCVLSVPTVVTGTNYRICSQQEDLQIRLPFLYERVLALVSLDIRP